MSGVKKSKAVSHVTCLDLISFSYHVISYFILCVFLHVVYNSSVIFTVFVFKSVPRNSTVLIVIFHQTVCVKSYHIYLLRSP